ncbi:UDP-3-O-(3-hydroxymyristoyl)glucosamine N-acyltransferase [Bdellovibrionota bacterium FG-2]
MSFSIEEILKWTGGRVANAPALGSLLEAIRVDRPAALAGSQARDLVFFFSREFESELLSSSAGIMITAEPFVKPMEAARLPFWKKTAIISCSDPYLAMAVLSEKFAPSLSTVAHVPSGDRSEAIDIHPTALVDRSAEIAPGVQIGAYCVVGAGARIGSGSVLYPGCQVGPKARLGECCTLFPSVILYELTELGDRVRIHAASVLGADGFGYAPRREGGKVVGHQKIYHLGRVVVGNDVEIGAQSTVDRGTFGETRIGAGAKLDNHVHVGHNASVGDGSILCGGICLAGNARIGKFVYMGGMTGVTNHVHIGDGAQVGACSLITKDVAAGGAAAGNPQREHKEHFKAQALLTRLLRDRESRKKGTPADGAL